MKHKDSIVLRYLAKTGSELINEMALKHEDGEFLPEITRHAPHLHKLKDKLLTSYCDLVADIREVHDAYIVCKQDGKSKFKTWLKNLEHHKRLENKLHFDSCFIDLGGDH